MFYSFRGGRGREDILELWGRGTGEKRYFRVSEERRTEIKDF